MGVVRYCSCNSCGCDCAEIGCSALSCVRKQLRACEAEDETNKLTMVCAMAVRERNS